MDDQTFNKELVELRGCQFMYLHESQKIERLVQSYLESPHLHSLDYNRQLLYHLLNSEYAPLQRFARTGLQPTGFWVSKFPRAGPWIVYALAVAIWVVSIVYAVSSSGSTGQSFKALALIAPLIGFTVYHLRGWLRLRAIAKEMGGLFDREIVPGHFDPVSVGDRLYALQQKGLRVHPHVFTLLRLQQHLQSPATDL